MARPERRMPKEGGDCGGLPPSVRCFFAFYRHDDPVMMVDQEKLEPVSLWSSKMQKRAKSSLIEFLAVNAITANPLVTLPPMQATMGAESDF